jgi:preprotein translocase subunit YajC
MSFFIADALADAGAAGAPQVPFFANPFFMLVIMVLFFYLFIIRPQTKRNKEHKQLLESLAKGDEVVITGGMLGKITKVSDDFVVIEVAPNTEIRFQRGAITATLPKGTIKNI